MKLNMQMLEMLARDSVGVLNPRMWFDDHLRTNHWIAFTCSLSNYTWVPTPSGTTFDWKMFTSD